MALENSRNAVFCFAGHTYFHSFEPKASGLVTQRDFFSAQKNVPLDEGLYASYYDTPLWPAPSSIGQNPYLYGETSEFLTIEELTISNEIFSPLVILLNCNSAAGISIFRPGGVSLANLFIKLGATSVIGNLWTVDLALAHHWCERFIEKWIKLRQPKAIAAKEVLKHFVKEEDLRYAHRWGTLALFGDWL